MSPLRWAAPAVYSPLLLALSLEQGLPQRLPGAGFEARLLEAHQQPDGSIRVPAALRPWLGGREVLEPAG